MKAGILVALVACLSTLGRAAPASPETSRFLGKKTAPSESGANESSKLSKEVSVQNRTELELEVLSNMSDAVVSFTSVSGVTQCCTGCSTGFCSPGSGRCYLGKSKPYYKDCSYVLHQVSMGCSVHEEQISDPWASCAAAKNRQCGSCGLYGAVSNHPKCGSDVAIVGEKVCPVAAVGGVESITQSNAGDFNNVWTCAASQTGSSPNMALILNPWKARTQHQFHVKTMPLDSRGQHLANELEKITDCQAGEWHNAHFVCPFSKAQVFDSMPNVLSKVFALASTGALGHLAVNPSGQPTLATVGVTVLFICGGKPVVLANGDGNGGCSIEHSIYSH